jgi:predicted CoA-substrate-specific enzyme activase
MHVVGIDAGSNAVKIVLIDDQGRMFNRIKKTGANSAKTAEVQLEDILADADLVNQHPERIVSTGYGRHYIEFSDKSVTEISCHARGVRHLFKDARTIIDIGGQDNKVIYLDEEGHIKDFIMNDKCAAGTGRFLEVMAQALDIELKQLGVESQKAEKEVPISSTCTVFAESEVVSHVARGENLPDIVAGIHRSIVIRVLGMAHRRTVERPLVITGGVAKNQGVTNIIQEEVGYEIIIPEEPQITGALGAALIALEEAENEDQSQ